MVFTMKYKTATELINNDPTTDQSNLCSVNSCKRRNSEIQDEVNSTDSINKKECTNDNRLIACPFSDFGCTSELRYNDLFEHFSSEFHKENVLKAIEIYVKQLHMKPLEDNDLRDLQKHDYAELLDVLSTLEDGVACLHNDNVEIHKNFVQLLSNIMEQQKQIEKVKKSEEENSQLISAVDMNSNILQTELETIKQILSDNSGSSSFDGSFIWKITDVTGKLANAKNGQQPSIYSSPFYSSPTGYKMCMRLYLNGDGQVKGTHMSLFFVVMRGDYDAILTWPFNHKVTFFLYDQTNARRHIIDSFRPDPKSNSFQRPRSNMNIASGIPKFLPLLIIQSEENPYVRDDCMFIRCLVDFESLPKLALPFLIGVNPGLPLSIQNKLIQSEIEKYRIPSSTSTSMVESPIKLEDLKVNK
ncbi:unnamed protein product [Rotaria magnacalcarata]|uniref:MATH domain-containing protein n=2 Tax=Rotaria magnacalcarata TaxID=392030 RepID=A0A816V0I0_9BILA|nr:unnamed protein product [Rotaria magnacalcarata]